MENAAKNRRLFSIKKYILILFGSPNNNGNTRKMVDYLKSDLNGYNFFEFNAYKELLQPCFGCNACKSTGQCYLSDFKKMEYFIREINPDILIIASPLYNFGFPAPLKAFFDRLQPYYNSFKRGNSQKKAILFMSSGKEFCNKNEFIKNLDVILRPLNFKIEYSCFYENTDYKESVSKDFQNIKFKIDNIKNKLNSQ